MASRLVDDGDPDRMRGGRGSVGVATASGSGHMAAVTEADRSGRVPLSVAG